MSFSIQSAPSVDPRLEAAIASRALAMVEAAGADEGLDDELEVGLRLTDDAEMRELNRNFRGKEEPTDVLAFALREAPGGEAAPHLLGDVVISVETAARQRGGRALGEELEELFAHGLCHLLGYDHSTDLEEAEMNARAAELVRVARARG